MARKQWEYLDTVCSQTTGEDYTISRHLTSGLIGCSCKAWRFHKAPKVACKHIIAWARARGNVLDSTGAVLTNISIKYGAVPTKPQPRPRMEPPRPVPDPLRDLLARYFGVVPSGVLADIRRLFADSRTPQTPTVQEPVKASASLTAPRRIILEEWS